MRAENGHCLLFVYDNAVTMLCDVTAVLTKAELICNRYTANNYTHYVARFINAFKIGTFFDCLFYTGGDSVITTDV